MVYNNYNNRKSKTKTKLRFRKFRPTVKRTVATNSTNMYKLQKQIDTIRKTIKRDTEYLNFLDRHTQDLKSPFNQICLTKYNTYSNIFGTDIADTESNKARHLSFGMDIKISLDNLTKTETDSIDYTVFLVSPKDVLANDINFSNGLMALVEGQHYVKSYTGGMTMINKKMFTIHAIKRLTTSNFGQGLAYPSASQFSPIVRWYYKVKVNKMIENPKGNWKSLNTNNDPSKNYFLLIFNNNADVDQEYPFIDISVVHTIQPIN